MDGFVDANALAFAVGDAGQTCAGEEAEGSGDDGGFVGDVAELVGC